MTRILKQNKGHCLLLGVGGTGKRSLAHFCIFLMNFTVFTIQITKNYKIQSWRDDLKNLIKQVGVRNTQTVLFLQDN